ncbi:hypothetical protein ACFE04_005333 [Oxalis oulophora]
MRFLFRSTKQQSLRSQLHHRRTLVDSTSIKHVRDRGLDHAVTREWSLKPLLNLKTLIQSEPSKSLPISIINDRKHSLELPVRPIEFIRKYPAIFREVCGTQPCPDIKLTPEVTNLDSEETLVYENVTYKQNVADRVLKLLMLTPTNKIPLKLVDLLKWDLGLPNDYLKTVVPEFPDCFRVLNGRWGSDLELVCWSDELAVSVLQKNAAVKVEKGKQGKEGIVFPIQYSADFEVGKDFKKWVDDWQKLPYLSPYESSVNLALNSDESDKWATGVLHELLHLFVGKKAEKEVVLCFGEHLGIRSRFKRAILNHPGIFYLSSKMGYTVVLREMYKRGFLLETNPLMSVRNQYVHLMYQPKENKKETSTPENRKTKKEVKTSTDTDHKVENQPEESDESDDESEGEEENQSHEDDQKVVLVTERKAGKEMDEPVKGSWRNKEKDMHSGKRSMNTERKVPPNFSRRKNTHEENKGHVVAKRKTDTETNSHIKGSWRNKENDRYNGKRSMNTEGKVPPKFSRSKDARDGTDNRGTSQEMSRSRKKEMPSPRKRVSTS